MQILFYNNFSTSSGICTSYKEVRNYLPKNTFQVLCNLIMQTHKFVYYVNGNFTVTTRAKTKHCIKSNQVYVYLYTNSQVIDRIFKYPFFQNFFSDMYFFFSYKSIYTSSNIYYINYLSDIAGFHEDFDK